MAKKIKAPADYKHITPALVKNVSDVIAAADKHTLSISKIFDAHNKVFKLNDPQQNCPSCLRTRVKNLRAWLAEYNKTKGKAPVADDANTTDTSATGQDPNTFTPEEEGDLMELLGITTESTPAEYAAALTEYLANNTDLDPADVAKAQAKLATLQPNPVTGNGSTPGTPAPVGEGVTRLSVAKVEKDGTKGDAVEADFTPNADAVDKGIIKDATTAKLLKPGKYVTVEDTPRNLSVQIGGKATFVAEDLT